MATISIDYYEDILMKNLRNAENALLELSHGKQIPLPKKPLDAYILLLMIYLKIVQPQVPTTNVYVLGTGKLFIEQSKQYKTTPLYPATFSEMRHAFLDFITLEPSIFSETSAIMDRYKDWIDEKEVPETFTENVEQ